MGFVLLWWVGKLQFGFFLKDTWTEANEQHIVKTGRMMKP